MGTTQKWINDDDSKYSKHGLRFGVLSCDDVFGGVLDMDVSTGHHEACYLLAQGIAWKALALSLAS